MGERANVPSPLYPSDERPGFSRGSRDFVALRATCWSVPRRSMQLQPAIEQVKRERPVRRCGGADTAAWSAGHAGGGNTGFSASFELARRLLEVRALRSK